MSYMQGCALIDRDAHAAAYWFSLAQSQGHPEALTALRRLQESRESAEKNAELAERVA
jgi:TPR repeat protein